MRKVGILILSLVLVGAFSIFVLADTPPASTAQEDEMAYLEVPNAGTVKLVVNDRTSAGSPRVGQFSGNMKRLDFDNVFKVKVISSSNWELALNIDERQAYEYDTVVGGKGPTWEGDGDHPNHVPGPPELNDYFFADADNGNSDVGVDGGGKWEATPPSGETSSYHVLASGSGNTNSPFTTQVDFYIDVDGFNGAGGNIPSGTIQMLCDFLVVEV